MPDVARTDAANPMASSPAHAAVLRHRPQALLRTTAVGHFQAAWPMIIARAWPGLRVLQAPCDRRYDVSGGPALSDDAKADSLIPLLLAPQNHPPHWPAVLVANAVCAEGAVWTTLRALSGNGSIRLHVITQWQRAVLERSAAPDAEAYLATFMSASQRKRLRQKQRALEECLGPITLETAMDPTSVASALEIFCTMEKAGWKGQAGTALAQDAPGLAYVSDVLVGLAESGNAFAAVLRAGAQPVAAGLFQRSGGEVIFWKTAYDEALSRHSPGVIFDVVLTEWLYRQPWFVRLDSGSDDSVDPASLIWKQRRTMANVVLDLKPPSLRGMFVLGGLRLRQWLRRIKNR